MQNHEQRHSKPKGKGRPYRQKAKAPTAWESFGGWYGKLVGNQGHYYHQQVILPGIQKMIDLRTQTAVLDLACGSAVFARIIPKTCRYVGIDAAPALIEQAKRLHLGNLRSFEVADVSAALPIKEQDFTLVTLILALQNIANPAGVIANAAKHLKPGGHFLVVLNHPCFRIPRQSSWGIDEKSAIQQRRLNRYKSPLRVPMQVNPSKKQASETMWAFHHSLEDYFELLAANGFSVVSLKEWISDRTSHGPKAKMENRARKEFPLFMALLCQKRS